MADPGAAREPAPGERYTPELAARIEAAWQDRWAAERTFETPNPTGSLAGPPPTGRKLYVLDMFPYTSGVGLHVGHPLGYIATDAYARFQRMAGRTVLHTMGYDAFGLPAEQHAIQTGRHPQDTTAANIAAIRGQLRRLGFGHDPRRSVVTAEPRYYRWTQWIFLQMWHSWYDSEADRARPVAELEEELAAGRRPSPDGRPWTELTARERRQVLDGHRLAYLAEVPVNWCPGLGTVLADEEVTPEGRSERGNYPVFRRRLRQWMLRITAYADRLVDDLERLDWPDNIRAMQRNWIGRSTGADIDFGVDGGAPIRVFTTRPDTLFGATFLVVAPEHPAAGVTAAHHPATGAEVPVFVADYVLAGYGTGAIMGVPAHDQRDFEFARAKGLPVRTVVSPPEEWPHDPGRWPHAYTGGGRLISSSADGLTLDGLDVPAAQQRVVAWLVATGRGRAAVGYRLRDWLFARQRYWGEPFPIVFDDDDLPVALPDGLLPVELPPIVDYAPAPLDPDDAASMPEPPLARVPGWVDVTLDLGDGARRYRRETSTMPQWAGSCWYELRYLDPDNDAAFCAPEVERYWMGPTGPADPGGVDLYVGGVEHAVLHLLYARFWHKVLYDLGYVSSSEPFRRLLSQGYVQAAAYTDERGFSVPAAEVEERDGSWWFAGRQVRRGIGKMGKSLKNAIAPDELIERYGADTLRVYEMSMGPLQSSRPWDPRAVVGAFRFLARIWNNVVDASTGAARCSARRADPQTRRLLARTVAAVRADYGELRFHTALARLTELSHRAAALSAAGPVPREVAEPLVLMVAPLAPHLAEELWSRLGHPDSLAREPFPEPDPAELVEERVTCVVQIDSRVRARVEVEAGIEPEELCELALGLPQVAAALAGRSVRTVVVRAPRLVNVVVGSAPSVGPM